jgi:hypothetical protein
MTKIQYLVTGFDETCDSRVNQHPVIAKFDNIKDAKNTIGIENDDGCSKNIVGDNFPKIK